MTRKVRVPVVGLDKTGLSHFAMVNAHHYPETLARDRSGFCGDAQAKIIPAPTYNGYEVLLEMQLQIVFANDRGALRSRSGCWGMCG